MRALLLLPCLLALGACEGSVTSATPLLSAGGEVPANGLWAGLAPGCRAPAGADVQNWPDCASPMWIKDGQMTFIFLAPVRSALIMSGGTPRIARLQGNDGKGGPDEFTYYAVAPEGGAPHRRATVWRIICGETEPSEEGCVARDEAQLRELARTAIAGPPTWTAVFVSPAD